MKIWKDCGDVFIYSSARDKASGRVLKELKAANERGRYELPDRERRRRE
jgi:hypothetical protein